MPSPAIHLNELCKTYRVPERESGMGAALGSLFRRRMQDIPAVDGLTLDLEPGEIVGFLGPNGAGKTTTLKMLAGLLHPTSGDCRVPGDECVTVGSDPDTFCAQACDVTSVMEGCTGRVGEQGCCPDRTFREKLQGRFLHHRERRRREHLCREGQLQRVLRLQRRQQQVDYADDVAAHRPLDQEEEAEVRRRDGLP